MSVADVDGRGQRGGGRPAQFYSVRAVAVMLDVSTRSVRRAIARGLLVAHRFGGAVRIADSDLRAFLAQHREV
jgi:excisionase family DNA binding protein